MRTKLDDLLAAWRARGTPVGLNQLEPRVWAAIAAKTKPDVTGIVSIRVAFIATIMVAGVAIGAISSTAAPAEASPFSLHSPYAPSTLLEDAP